MMGDFVLTSISPIVAEIPNANGMSSHDGVYVIATDTGLKGYNKDGGTEALPADITPPSGHNTKTMDTFTNSTGQIVVATSVTAKKMSNPHPGNPSYATALLNDVRRFPLRCKHWLPRRPSRIPNFLFASRLTSQLSLPSCRQKTIMDLFKRSSNQSKTQ